MLLVNGVLLPRSLGHIDRKHVPNRALWLITFLAMILGSVFPFTFLATLVSAGTLVAFIFVSLGIYALRPREGKDLPEAQFKMPGYPVCSNLILFSAIDFLGIGRN